jgi:hypothetical protein
MGLFFRLYRVHGGLNGEYDWQEGAGANEYLVSKAFGRSHGESHSVSLPGAHADSQRELGLSWEPTAKAPTPQRLKLF